MAEKKKAKPTTKKALPDLRQGVKWFSDGLKAIVASMGNALTLREVAVEPGSTLWSIAEKELGDGKRWKEVYLLNIVQMTKDQVSKGRIPTPELIYPGQTVKLWA